MRHVLVFFAAALIAGCFSPGPRQGDRYFILEAPPGAHARAAVAVAPMSASSFYDTQDMVYSRAPGTRAYYQYSYWTERPRIAIQAQIASRLQGERGGLVLDTHLDEIYHDAAQAPGVARIALTAELLDPASRKVLARRTFTRSAPAASFDAAGAVQGFREALGGLLDDLVAWVDAVRAGEQK